MKPDAARYVILAMNPRTGSICAIMNDQIDRLQQCSLEEAEELARTLPILKAWPHQIVELEDHMVRAELSPLNEGGEK